MNYLPQDYFDFWPWKIIEPTFTKKSFLDNSGMLRIMEELLSDRSFQRKFSYLTVDVNTGQAVIFDETTPIEIRNKSILASASLPGTFPPVEIDGMFLVDGGTFQNALVSEPIARC